MTSRNGLSRSGEGGFAVVGEYEDDVASLQRELVERKRSKRGRAVRGVVVADGVVVCVVVLRVRSGALVEWFRGGRVGRGLRGKAGVR